MRAGSSHRDDLPALAAFWPHKDAQRCRLLRDLEDPIVVSDDHPGTIAAAQVHAVLALAAATALDTDRREWLNVAGGKLSD